MTQKTLGLIPTIFGNGSFSVIDSASMSSSLFPVDSGREKAIFRRSVFRLKDRERRMGDLETDGGNVGFFGDI
jgi:hypothetical protein